MNKKRESLWNAATLENYLDTTEELARKSAAEKNGEHTAENLENIWAGLGDEEKSFIEFLYLSEKRAVVARYDDGLFSGLKAKEMLQIPPGVGTLFMQEFETTYAVPIAVWKKLRDRSDQFFSHDGKEKTRRLEELAERFENQVDALLKAPSSEA